MRLRLAILGLSIALGACGPSGDDTPGECTDRMILAGDLVITEVFADADAPTGGSSADEGKEWFEVYNNADRPIDLEGMTVTHSRPDDTMGKSHVMRTVTIPANGYLVLGNTLPDLVPAWVDYGFADTLGDFYNTNGGKLKLSCGASEIDNAVYDMVEPGVSREFDGGGLPDYTANDDLANWCAATAESAEEFDPANFGTPRQPNQDCEVVIAGQCNDGGTMRDTVPPAAGDLVITEVMASPDAVGDDLGEWFEVLVTRDVDLNDVILDRVGDTAGGDPVLSEDCLHVAAGTYVVFARSDLATENGMLPPVAGTFDFTMVGGSVASPGDIQILLGTTVIDAFTWTRTANGTALQVDPDFATTTDNDLEANWCNATAPYGAGDLGTPGAVNEQCPVVIPPGMCFDEGTMVPRPIVKPTVGAIDVTEVLPHPKLAGVAGEWAEIHAITGFDLNGLQLGDHNTPLKTAVTVSSCVPLAAGGYAVFAQLVDPTMNGMVMNVVAAFPSGVDEVDSNGRIDVGVDDVVLDTLGWTTSVLGTSIQIDTDGTQCNAPAGTPAYNGMDVGTPGAVHSAECP